MPVLPFRFTALLACTLLVACSASPQRSVAPTPPSPNAMSEATTGDAGARWRDDVTAISAHRDSPGRRAAIATRLEAARITPRDTAFAHEQHRGINLFADVAGPRTQPLLLLGAHYDQVDVGSGVTDNAAGSAVVLELARRFHAAPLQHHRVVAAFWDLEEKGLLGAHAYVAGGGEKPALYVNFDVFGWGDTLWMMAPDAAHPLVAASDVAAKAHGLQLSSGDKYPPTDHLAFLKAGWPAVSYSLVGGDEIAPILRMFAREDVATPPKVMQVIHSPNDTLEQVDAAQAASGIDAIEAALRAWDAASDG